jgi:hypothetical protein
VQKGISNKQENNSSVLRQLEENAKKLIFLKINDMKQYN